MARKRSLYKPNSNEPHKLSWSRINNFHNCPRCFYLEETKGIKAPSGPQFLLNSAVDNLYKNEFDYYRKKEEPHPLMIKNNVSAIPYAHRDLDIWRDPFKGISWHHEESNFIFHGGVDEIWINESKELHIVDYKSTSKKDFNPNFNSGYTASYKKQLEFYQWLFEKNGHKMSKVGFIVYANGKKDEDMFDGKLHFDEYVFPIQLDTAWIEISIKNILNCLNNTSLPKKGEGWNGAGCEQCNYKEKLADLMRQQRSNQEKIEA